MSALGYQNRDNICIAALTRKLIECEGGQLCIYGKLGTGKKTLQREIARSLISVERFSQHIFWLCVGKIDNVMELLTLVDYIGHQILNDAFGDFDNNYRPDNIEDWLMYIKSNSPISEIVLFLSDVVDQFVIDVFSLLKIRLVVSTCNTNLRLTNSCASIHLDDFSEIEAHHFLGQIVAPVALPATARRLLCDISRSPLEVRMVGYLINRTNEPIDECIESVITRRVNIASAMVAEQDDDYNRGSCDSSSSPSSPNKDAASGLRSPVNTSPLLTRVMPRMSSPDAQLGSSMSSPNRSTADVPKTSSWWDMRMRQASVYITLQLVLESLPEHIQVKYVLLGVVPSGQPVSTNLLRLLWKCESNDSVLEIVHVLREAALIQVDKRVISTSSIDPVDTPQMFILHALQLNYLRDLLSLPVWHHRLQLAALRLAEYLTLPSARIEDDEFFCCNHKSFLSQAGVSSGIHQPASVVCHTFVRLGLFCRQLVQFGQQRLMTEPINPFQLFQDAIGKLDRANEVSSSVKYVLSACSVVEEMGFYQVDVVISWHLLLLSLMEEDPESSHSDIAQHTTALSMLLMERGDLIDAQRTVTKALNIYISIYGTDHYSVCSTYATLATIAQKRRCFDEAIEYYNEILEIKSRLLGTRHPRVGRDLNTLAMLLASQCEFSEAILNHMGAIKAFAYTYGEEHSETINARGNMGITMLLKGDMEGLTIIQESICMLVRAGFSTKHPWMKKFLDYARRGEVGSSVSEGIDVENATFQPTQFTHTASEVSVSRPEDKAWHKSESESVGGLEQRLFECNFLQSSGLGMMSGMGLHRLNATPLSLSDVETYRNLIATPGLYDRQSKVSNAARNGENDHSPLERERSLTCEGIGSSVVEDIATRDADTDRLPFAALVLTE